MFRRATGFLFVVFLATLLVGCEQVLAEVGSASIRRDGNDLLIATCDSLTIEQFSISARSRSEPFAKTVRMVTLRGYIQLPAGHIYRVGENIAGMKVIDSNPIDVSDLGVVSVEVSSPSVPNLPLFRVWDLEGDYIPDSMWLMPDGTTTPEPCP